VTGCATRAHVLATGDTTQNRVMQLTRGSIRSRRDLAGLDNARGVQAAVDNAARLIAVPADMSEFERAIARSVTFRASP